MSTAILQALEKWSEVALEQKWVEKWVEGAIFPREMVFFLATCEVNGVVNIIESGRQDGYSTEIIGFYAQQRNGKAYSIDLELDRERADRCRRRLSGNPNLIMLKGNSLRFVGPVALADRVPTALLIDGPKGYSAISLLLAASGFEWVRIGAIHNLHLELSDTIDKRQMFVGLAPGPHFFEDVAIKSEDWAELEKVEQAHCAKMNSARSLENSSLGVMQLTHRNNRSLWRKLHPKFGFRQPLRLYTQWALLG